MLSLFSLKSRKNRSLHQKRAAYLAGVRAEHAVCLYLMCAGYTILARRMQTPAGEIDILARRRHVLLAAEVKYRASADTEPVTYGQQQRLIAATEFALQRHGKGKLLLQRDVFLIGKMSFKRIRCAF